MKDKNLLMIPGPVQVDPAVLHKMQVEMFSHRSKEYETLQAEVCANLQKVLGAKGNVFVITGSGTAAIEFMVSNLVAPGEKIVCCVNGVFGKRLAECIKVFDEDMTVIESPAGSGIDLEGLRYAVSAGGVKIVACVLNETSTGVFNQINEVGKIAKSAGAMLIVDDVSGVGNPFSMDEVGVDALATATQKAIGAPPGLAFAIFNEKAMNKARNTPHRNFYFNFETFEKFAKKNQTPYTPPISILLATKKSTELILAEGVDEFVKRHNKCARATRAAMKALGFSLFADPAVASNCVTSVACDFSVELVTKMKQDFKVQMANGQDELKGKIFRIGHMGPVDWKDLLLTVSAMEMALLELKGEDKIGVGTAAFMREWVKKN